MTIAKVMKGNKAILLDSPEKVWVVKSGSLALFTTQVEAGEAIGNRHYLFSVSTGEALFGVRLWTQPETKCQYSILALTLQETELQLLELADITKCIGMQGENISIPEELKLLEGWIHNLSQLVAVEPPVADIRMVTKLEPDQLSLQVGQALQVLDRSVVWVQASQGHAAWMGLEDLILDHLVWFPMTSKTWLKAIEPIEVYIKTTIALDNEQLVTSLSCFHEYINCYLYQHFQKEAAVKVKRLQEQEQLNRQNIWEAISTLAANVTPQQQTFEPERTPLLIAAGYVGQAMGITIYPPKSSEKNQRHEQDSVAEIALASNIQTRRVILAGDWWRQDNGSLLAFTQADNRPVALLIDKSKGDRYFLFDPELQIRTLVSERIATTLAPEAYMFYQPLPSVINQVTDILQFGIKGYERDIFMLVAVGMIGTLLGMITPQATAILINTAIPNGDRLILLQLSCGLLAVSFGRTILTLSQGLISQRVAQGTRSKLQVAVWDRLLKLKPSLIRIFSSGDMLMRIMSINKINSIVSGAIQRTLLNGLFSLLNLGLMFIYNVPLALVGIGIALVTLIFTAVSSLSLLPKVQQQQGMIGRIQGLVVQLVNGVSKLRVAAAEERAFATWAKRYSVQIQFTRDIIHLDNIVSIFNDLLTSVSSLLLYWFGFAAIQSTLAGQGTLTLGTFLAFNVAFGTFFAGVVSLSNTFTDIIQVVPLWKRAASILQGELESDSNTVEPEPLTGRVSLQNVSFRYRKDGPLILDCVSINAEPGEFIAIVGPSGSGKSTIFRTLLGFEMPLSGAVFYDGQNLAKLNLSAVRRQLGVVLQNSKVMQGSIFDNITTGALVSMEKAWDAARMAGLASDIEQMPMGIHTLVSEGGSNISGGQLQRLLIARSLVFQPKILLMDEATSFLDNRTQAIVTASLERLNVTRIVIAHRLSTIRHADRIYVIERGKVVQEGSFAELMQQPGLFARLVARQLS